MNCCKDNKSNENNDRNNNHAHKGHMSHMLMMALCCGAPVLLLLLIPLLGNRVPALSGILTGIAPFICPLMMFLMIPMMFRGNKKNAKDGSHCETEHVENKQLE